MFERETNGEMKWILIQREIYYFKHASQKNKEEIELSSKTINTREGWTMAKTRWDGMWFKSHWNNSEAYSNRVIWIVASSEWKNSDLSIERRDASESELITSVHCHERQWSMNWARSTLVDYFRAYWQVTFACHMHCPEDTDRADVCSADDSSHVLLSMCV